MTKNEAMSEFYFLEYEENRLLEDRRISRYCHIISASLELYSNGDMMLVWHVTALSENDVVALLEVSR